MDLLRLATGGVDNVFLHRRRPSPLPSPPVLHIVHIVGEFVDNGGGSENTMLLSIGERKGLERFTSTCGGYVFVLRSCWYLQYHETALGQMDSLHGHRASQLLLYAYWPKQVRHLFFLTCVPFSHCNMACTFLLLVRSFKSVMIYAKLNCSRRIALSEKIYTHVLVQHQMQATYA